MRWLWAGVVCAVAIGQGNGQVQVAGLPGASGAAKVFRYEVVSVREVKGDPKAVRFVHLPDGFSMEGLPLESLIPDAYGIYHDDRVSGWPGWATSTRFDIEAKMDVETADALRKLSKEQQEAQRQVMLQSLMEERFKLKVHRAVEVRMTYELVLAKSGLKMKEDNPAADMDGNKRQEGVQLSTDWMIFDGKISGHAMPVTLLANHLQDWVHTTIVDKTGLTGRYDVVLKWDPKDGQDPNSSEPSLFIALEEQLGLRLKPAKTEVETIVIDHLEMPSEN